MVKMSEKELADEQLQWQRDEQVVRYRARNEANLGLENFLRSFQLPINLGILRRVLEQQETFEKVFYSRLGNLTGKDYASMRIEDDNNLLYANLESDPETLEVRRLLKISEIFILHQGYKFSPQFLNGTQGVLVSPKQEVVAPFTKKGHYLGFYFPDRELTDSQYTFRFRPSFHLGFARIPFIPDENLPQDYL